MALFQKGYAPDISLTGDDTNEVLIKYNDENAKQYTELASVASWFEGNVAPLNPVTGMKWKDATTSPAILKRWNGLAWESENFETTSTLNKVAKGDSVINVMFPPVPFLSAKGDGVTDDSVAIQTIIDSIVEGFILLPGKTFKINSKITIDPSKVGIIGYGAVFDCSGIINGESFLIQATTSSSTYRHYNKFMEGFRLFGAGIGTNTIGFEFNTLANGKSSITSLRNIEVEAFGVGANYKNSAYLIQWSNCSFNGNGTHWIMNDGFLDYGENISAIQCVFFNGVNGVVNYNRAGQFHFVSCSFDYNSNLIDITEGNVTFSDCHIEAGDYTTPPIKLNTGAYGGSTIVISGGELQLTSIHPHTVPYIVQCDTNHVAGGGITFDKVKFINISTATGDFATGGGIVNIINSFSETYNNMPDVVGLNQNFMFDGTFEQTTILDDIFINNENGVPIIPNRLNGTNGSISLSTLFSKTGTQSLKLTQTSAVGFTPVIAFPITQGQIPRFRYYYKKPGTSGGTIYLSVKFAKIQINTNGVPLITASREITSVPVVFTTAEVDWTKFTDGTLVHKCPSGYTHVVLYFTMASWIGDLYIDDVNMGFM